MRTQLHVAVVLLLAATATAADHQSVRADAHFVRIDAKELTGSSRAQLTPISQIDYGTYLWLELDDEGLARLDASGASYQQEPEPFTLRLGEVSFDPRHETPNLPPELAAGSDTGPDLHLVQMVGPTKTAWLDALQADGLEIVQYIHPHTYVVWGHMGIRAATEAQPHVRWVGTFAPAYRIQPKFRNLPGQMDEARALLYRGADVDHVLGQIEALGAKVRSRRTLNTVYESVGFDISAARLPEVANIPGVYSVRIRPKDGGPRGEMANQVNVNNVDGTNLAFPGYDTWLTAVGLDGNGVIMANVDGGIQEDHPDLVGRMLGCVGDTCGGSTMSSHGTHTAGIMAADGSSGTLDSFGFLRGQGVAPGANLVEQVYSDFFELPGGMLMLMKDSYNNGALLSGNSWGPAGVPHGYDDDTMQVDIGVRDAVDNAPGNQPLTYVLSFMNGFGGTSSQGTPDEAKNLFNIGSTKMQNGNGSQILDIDDLSANTAHGPALDGRTIPHMVAPGCSVDSTVPISNHAVAGFCGTSMASPHVSGAVALFIEYYRLLPGYTADPSPALIKAAFLPVARDLAGNLDADGGVLGHVFDSKQGWGRMDLEAVVDPQVAVRYWDNPTVFDNTGEEWNTIVTADDPALPLKVMLVWTDAPGHGLGGSTPAWNNNLDLLVNDGFNTFFGNRIGPAGWSVVGGPIDGKNNTEGVFIGPTAPDFYTIRVLASNLNSDAIPGVGGGTDQDFALVCYNCAEEDGFTISADPSAISICTPDDAGYTVDVGSIGSFSDPVTLSATGHPAGTTAVFSTNPVNPPDTSALTISNTAAAAAGNYTITIEGEDPLTAIIKSTMVGLEVFTGVPGAPALSAPPDGTVSVPLVPTLSWSASSQADTYDVEVATDAAFNTVVFSTTTADLSVEVSPPLVPLTAYHWRVTAGNACGPGGVSPTWTFLTADVPRILLVDDDDNDPNVRSYYTDTLDAMGLGYDLWDTGNSDNEPDAATLSPYSVVIWFTGAEFGGAAGPGAPGEAALASFLDASGCLFITSQDYVYDRGGVTGFMSSYLGLGSAVSDVGQSAVTGNGSIFGSLGTFTLTYPSYSNYSDNLEPDATAETAFIGNVSNCAVNKDNGTYRTTFWGFPFDAIPALSDRVTLLTAVLDMCGESTPLEDCNSNGVADPQDLFTGTSPDCNEDGTPDECEIDAVAGPPGTYFCTENCDPDCNHNGIPDACDHENPVTLLAADFEAGLPSGWPATGLWHATGTCGPTQPCDGTQWGYFGQNASCDFDTGARVFGSLTATPVQIPADAISATLTYCSAYGGEGGIAGTSGFDWAWLEINGTMADDVSADNDAKAWQTRTVDLSAFAGQTVTLCWRFDSVDGNANTELGWVIDQIEVVAVSTSFDDCNTNGIWDVCDIDDGTSPDGNSNGVPDECDPGIGIVAAASCLDHAGTTWCVNLMPDAIEMRKPGIGEVVIDLSDTVSSVGASVSCSPDAYGGSVSTLLSDSDTVVVTFDPAIPDRQCCRIQLTGDVDASFEVHTLAGDVDQNGAVNASDKFRVKGDIGEPLNSLKFVHDVNLSGAINATDKNMTKGWIGHLVVDCP
ncbi:MAG: S8 family serine peptidase [bacterium]|nr:S8 family serine peptidase [bacterium]